MEVERVKQLLDACFQIFSREPQLITREDGEFLIVGDTHGDLDTTLRAIEIADEEGLSLLFLGDYVDRGPKQLENILKLLELKLSWGERLIMLRGNHETMEMNLWYGFHSVVASRYGEELYREFSRLFSQLPYAAALPDKILCIHGGIAEGLGDVNQIRYLPKGEINPRDPIALQILWNDPSEDVEWFVPSWRGGGAKLFGWKAFTDFMSRNKLDLLVRAHEPQDKGYGYIFDGKLLTIFSCRYYGIRPAAAVLRKKIEIVYLD